VAGRGRELLVGLHLVAGEGKGKVLADDRLKVFGHVIGSVLREEFLNG
jgi:hypothetical protein